MLDLLIQGGTVVDGTGAARRTADVGIRDGRVVAIAAGVDESARRRVDATGLVVAPGFVDIHTHYDAQLFWDPTASPSPFHGVTTVFGGNCGFTLAPTSPTDSEYLRTMMARVEGLPVAALESLPWDWTSFGDYLARLDSRVSVNAGFLVGHCAIRRAAMGEAALTDKASEGDIATMRRITREALQAGAIGFSTTLSNTHSDATGRPVPSRVAARDEVLALAATAGEFAGTTVEAILSGCFSGFDDADMELMTAMSRAADRPLNWNVLAVTELDGMHDHQLQASDYARDRGGRVVALVMPHVMPVRYSFLSGFGLTTLPEWEPLFRLPPVQRVGALRDRSYRDRLRRGAQQLSPSNPISRVTRWHELDIAETFAPQTAPYAGRRLHDVALDRGQDPFDALLDIVVDDELRTGIEVPSAADDPQELWDTRARIWRDERTIVGGSDAGAHLDMMCGAVTTTWLLGEAVRERGLLTLEEAVHQLADVPARLYGLRGRGRVIEGGCADVVLFDPNTVGPLSMRTRADLPGGAARLYAGAEGIESVYVNGVEIVHGGEATGATPGTLLRSGRDTDTVTAAGSSAG